MSSPRVATGRHMHILDYLEALAPNAQERTPAALAAHAAWVFASEGRTIKRIQQRLRLAMIVLGLTR